MPAVVLTGVSRVFQAGVVACDKIDLEVGDGELLVLVGPSGSGKTTLLRIIAGLDRPTSGQVAIGGRDVTTLPARLRDVAMVFQSHALYPHWTAAKNIAFGLRLRSARQSRTAIQERVVETAREVGIERLLNRMPAELSGGEQQRVALARAIARRPALFLFDEPFASLDPPLRVELRQKLKELHQRLGATMIYVTHDQADALAVADRVAVLNQGRIEQVGAPQEVYDRPASTFVAGFIGSPKMNFFDCRPAGLKKGDRHLAILKTGDISPNSSEPVPVFQPAVKKGGRHLAILKTGDISPNSSEPVPVFQPAEVEGHATECQLSADGWAVGVEGRFCIQATDRQPLVVGLRPEDVHLRTLGDGPAEDGPSVTARIDLVEHLGDSCVVSLVPPETGEESKKQASPERPGAVLLCKCQVRSGLAPGEHVIACFDMRRAHWFDGRTGRNLHQP